MNVKGVLIIKHAPTVIQDFFYLTEYVHLTVGKKDITLKEQDVLNVLLDVKDVMKKGV